MNSYPWKCSTKDDGEIVEELDDDWDELEDELTRKRKIRLVSKYSEKRSIP